MRSLILQDDNLNKCSSQKRGKGMFWDWDWLCKAVLVNCTSEGMFYGIPSFPCKHWGGRGHRKTGFAAAACKHSLGFTVQSNLSLEMFVPGPASADGAWQRVRVTTVTLEAPEEWLAMSSCCLFPQGKAEGETALPEANTAFSGNWGGERLRACGFFSPETPQLIWLVSLSLFSPLAKIDSVILCSFLPGLMFCHVKRWVWICT